MTEPTRWLDDGNAEPEIRELVRAGARPPRFPEAALAATIIPLAHKAALASTWSLPAAAATAIKATSLGLAIGLGSIAAVTALSGPARSTSETMPVHKAPVTAGVGPARGSSVPAAEFPDPAPEAAPPASTELPNQPVAVSSGASTAAGQSLGIAAEAALLERARATLDQSPSRALLLTDEHRRRFAKGQLVAERELIAIDALLRLGRKYEAQTRARPLLVEGTSQVFAQRLRNLLDRHGP